MLQQVCEKQIPVVVDSNGLRHVHRDSAAKGCFLYCPIIVGDEVNHVLFASNEMVKDCFSADEIRIAEFIAGAAGSALEKAAGIVELDSLNRNLENKVQERTASLKRQTKILKEAKRSLEIARNEAECANQSKSDFLARMSHEIRTPISAVIGFADLILRGIVATPAEVHKRIETIHSSGEHLLSLVNDLLDLSKVEADRLECESIECNPIKLCFDVYQSLLSKTQEKDVNFVLDFSTEIPATINSDPTRLTQVLVNLVGNAIKFTESGKVLIDVSYVRVDPDAQFLEISITDSGIGMTEEQTQKIFEPFVQADTSTTRKFGGTGLGLSITKRIVEMLGGSINVQSQLGEGSRFTLQIPVEIDSGQLLVSPDEVENFLSEAEESTQIVVDLNETNILIVDDSETNRDLLTYLLHDANANTATADNGQQAIDIIANVMDLDVVLMDMQMPVLGGLEATRRLRQSGFDKPIVALTANSMNGDAEICLQAGCTAYMSKPIDTDKLLVTLANLLDREVQNVRVTPNSPANLKKAGTTKENGSAVNSLRVTHKAPRLTAALDRFAKKFSANILEHFDDLKSLASGREPELLRQKVHQIKGTAGSVGLMEITETSCEIELKIENRDWLAVEKLLEKVESMLKSVLSIPN